MSFFFIEYRKPTSILHGNRALERSANGPIEFGRALEYIFEDDTGGPPVGDFILLEDGSDLLLEDGTNFLLE